MRLYGCFEIEDVKGPVSAPLPAEDLRIGQPVKLYRWTPEAGHLASSQTLTKEICARAGVEVFGDGKALWLVEAGVSVGTVLRELQAKQLFLDLASEPVPVPPLPPPPPTTRCATCKTVRDAGVAACPTCAAVVKPPPQVLRYVLVGCVLALLAAIAYLVLRPPSRAPDAQLAADRTQIRSGEWSTLRWSSGGADRVTLDDKIVEPNAQSVVVAPLSDRTYTLRATNRAGTTQREVTIHVRKFVPPVRPPKPLPADHGSTSPSIGEARPAPLPSDKVAKAPPLQPPDVEVTVYPSVVQSCRPAMLHWQITGGQSARAVDLQPRFFSLPTNGERDTMIIQPPVSADYTLTFTMPDGHTIVKTQHVDVTRQALRGPPDCGQIIWSGTVPRNGQVAVLWEHGKGQSQPETGATISGSIPDSGVQLSAIEPWASVFAQPDNPLKPTMQFLSSHTGRVVIHFFWQRAGTK